MPYRITVHDSAGDITGTLVDVTDVSLTRSIRGTERIRFSLPRNSDQISDLQLGTWVHVEDTVRLSTLASGLIGSQISLPDDDLIQFNCMGIIALLGRYLYPPGYILTGTLQANRDRMTSAFDWRSATAITPTDSTVDMREISTLLGNTGGADVGHQWRATAGDYDVIAWEMHTDTDEGAAGIVTPKGTDPDGDGVFNDPPFGVSGAEDPADIAVYESPYCDMEPPDVLSTSAGPDRLDRLKFGGAWNDDSELFWEVRQYAATSDARPGTPSTSITAVATDPEGIGEDLTGLSFGADVDLRSYYAINFAFSHLNPDSYAIGIMWWQLIAQTAIPGIQAGGWPTVDLEDNIEIGGASLLDGLDRIAETYELEYQVADPSAGVASVDVQSIPKSEQWVLSHGAVTGGPFQASETVTGGTSGATGSIIAGGVDVDDSNKLTIAAGGGGGIVAPKFEAGETITGGVSGATATVNSVPLTLGSRWGADYTDRYAFRDEMHINIVKWHEDSTELVNYLIAEGTGAGMNRSQVIDQADGNLPGESVSSQAKYGLRQKVVQFNKKSIADLAVEANKHLLSHQNPRRTATVQVLETPDGTTVFKAGDRIRIQSSRLVDMTGAKIDTDMRITRETRRWTEEGEMIELELEKGSRTRYGLARNVARELSALRRASDRTLTHYSTGIIDTEDITPPESGGAGEYDVMLEFTPVEVEAYVIEVEDTVTGNWYTASSGPFTVDIVKKLPGTRSAAIRIMKIDGTNKTYRARIKWEAWGNRLNDLPRVL